MSLHTNLQSSFFEFEDALYIPDPRSDFESITESWVEPSACIWDGPKYLQSRTPLACEVKYRDNPILVKFVRDILRIPDLDWALLLQELELKMKNDHSDQTNILDIYQRLNRCRPDLDEESLSSIW